MKRALVALALAACTDSLAVPEAPLGRLAIHPNQDKGCSGNGGCDVNVAADNHVTLLATDDRPTIELRAASSEVASAVVTDQRFACSCRAQDGTAVTIDLGGDCKTLPKVCAYTVEVDTKAAGVADITFSTPTGDLVDLARLRVKVPTSVTFDLAGRGPAQTRPGRTIVFAGADLTIDSAAYDEANVFLIAPQSRWTVTSSNASVVLPDPSDPTKAKAVAVGSADLTLARNGLTVTRSVDVVVE